MSPRTRATIALSRTRALSLLLSALLLLALAGLVSPSAAQAAPIEDYPTYQAGTKCRPQPKPGTVYLGKWMVRKFGGSYGSVGRACSDATSEHEEGRAFDWTLDATKKADRKVARKFLVRIFATDQRGHEDALARRMGIMYVIWNDRVWSAWRTYEADDYLSSSCKTKKKCSKTLRHRDHVHVSQTRAGGRGRTSWFEGRLD